MRPLRTLPGATPPPEVYILALTDTVTRSRGAPLPDASNKAYLKTHPSHPIHTGNSRLSSRPRSRARMAIPFWQSLNQAA